MNGTYLIAGILLLVLANGLLRADPDDRRDKLVALGWGSALAVVSYLLWSVYSVDDLRGGWSWITGDGTPVIGIALLGVAGYVWYESAQEADDADEMMDELRERTAGPVLQFAGILSAILVTLITLVWTSGSSAAMLLGFVGDMLATAPAVASNVFTIIVGFVALDGTIPLIDPLLPDLSRVWYVGLSVASLGVAVMIRNTGDD